MQKEKRKYPNAYKHGVFADIAIVPGEDKRQFAELCLAVIGEWMPNGPTELDTVLSIAKAIWRKRRLQKFIESKMLQNSVDPTHPSYDEVFALKAISAYMKSNPTMDFAHYAQRGLRPETIKHFESDFPRSDYDSDAQWRKAIINEIDTKMLPPLKSGIGEANELIEFIRSAASITDESFKQEIALDERLDLIIERAVKRLVQTKAMKQVLAETLTDRRPIGEETSVTLGSESEITKRPRNKEETRQRANGRQLHE